MAYTLTHFPDSWILPLIPILLRIILDLYRLLYVRYYTKGYNKQVPCSIQARLWDSTRRLVFFHLIMQFRGWGLYVFLGKVEDILIPFFTSSRPAIITSKVHSIMDMDTVLTQQDASCWYSQLIHPTDNLSSTHMQSTPHETSTMNSLLCKGQIFDFSDHVVYFYAHVLPPLVFEALFCLLFPFWQEEDSQHRMEGCTVIHQQDKQTTTSTSTSTVSTLHDTNLLPNKECTREESIHPRSKWTTHVVSVHSVVSYMVHLHIQGLHSTLAFLFNWILPPLFVMAFLYFNLLVFLAIHTTAAVHHTVREVVVGYSISLLVQIPLGMMLCTEKWSTLRSLVGLGSIKSVLSKEETEKLI